MSARSPPTKASEELSIHRWTVADIPDQSGRVAVITGANTGVGYETALALAARGAHVVLAVRNLDKGNEAAGLIATREPGASVALQALDLSSLESIRASAEQLRLDYNRIDLLVNNAGVFTEKASTKDGFELHFGTNHLGHFALTGLLLDRLLRVPGSRIVTVSSNGHRAGRICFEDLHWERRRYNRMAAYGQSKLANLLFTYELQRRLAATETIAVAAHPGQSKTELARNIPARMRPIFVPFDLVSQSAAMGALATLRAATDPGVMGGEYFGPRGGAEMRGYPGIAASNARSHDILTAKRLWDLSEELTGTTYDIG